MVFVKILIILLFLLILILDLILIIINLILFLPIKLLCDIRVINLVWWNFTITKTLKIYISFHIASHIWMHIIELLFFGPIFVITKFSTCKTTLVLIVSIIDPLFHEIILNMFHIFIILLRVNCIDIVCYITVFQWLIYFIKFIFDFVFFFFFFLSIFL